MAFFSEIFFSTLIGRPVYTVDEKYYGNFRDFIVKRQNGNFVITKVRIRPVAGRGRVIIPWSDVHSIEAEPVMLKLKRKIEEINPIDYDENELRLKRDVLDQQVIDTKKSRVVRVNDLKIVAVKDELFMVAADIGFRGLLRRLGLEKTALAICRLFNIEFQNSFVPSKYIDPFPARIRHDIKLSVAQEQLKQMHPADLADVLSDLDNFERISILQALPPEVTAKTLAELEPGIRKKVLGKLKDETVTKLLEKLAPDAATDIVMELPKNRMRHLLNAMKITEADEIRELLKFKKDTAGSIMNPEFVSVPENFTVAEALDKLREKGGHAEQIFYLYATDAEGTLKGVVSLRSLIFVDPKTPVTELIKRKPMLVRSRAHMDEVVEKFTKYNLIVLPVVGKKGRIEGVITVDDVLAAMQKTS